MRLRPDGFLDEVSGATASTSTTRSREKQAAADSCAHGIDDRTRSRLDRPVPRDGRMEEFERQIRAPHGRRHAAEVLEILCAAPCISAT